MELDSRSALEFRQQELKRQITYALDLLAGQLNRSPSQGGYHLNRKVQGRHLTRYVRKRLVPQVRAMIQNRRRVEQLLDQLSDVNWRLLQLPAQAQELPSQED
jgi:hypothetical protein